MTSFGRRPHGRGTLYTLVIVILSIVSSTVGVTAASAHAVSGHAARLMSNAGNIPSSLPFATTSAPQNFILVSYNSAKCLDVANYGTRNLDNVQQWTCHSPSTQNQLWGLRLVTLWTDPNTGSSYDVVNIVEKGTNECLEAEHWGINNGTNVDIYNCAPASQMHGNQLWILQASATNTPMYIWNYGATIDRGSDIALDVVCTRATNYGKNNGANVQLWQEDRSNSCSGRNQIWVVENPF